MEVEGLSFQGDRILQKGSTEAQDQGLRAPCELSPSLFERTGRLTQIWASALVACNISYTAELKLSQLDEVAVGERTFNAKK
eukprot:1143151-Pelagomonas_calceolata.AAC.4